MRRDTKRIRKGVSLVAAVLVFGCAHSSPRPQPAVAQVSQALPPSTMRVTDQAVTMAPPSQPTEEPIIVTGGVPDTYNNPALTRGEPPPARRSFVDTTAQPFFGHAEDYTWLQGQLEYSHLSKAWRLRYASVDSEDAYGGSVTLAESNLLQKLKDGQYVRVEGRIGQDGEILQTGSLASSAENKNIAPLYHVGALKPIEEQ